MADGMQAERASADIPTQLRVQPFSEGRGTWRELLKSCLGVTLYHRESWIELLSRAYGFSLWLATLEQSRRTVAGCVFVRRPLSRCLIALPFSDTGLPLSRDYETAQRLLEALIAQAAPGRAYEVRGIAGAAPWETVECFVDWKLRLDRPAASIERALALNFRRSLRRASQQAVRIERGSAMGDLERFYAMQLESRRRLGLPPQPWRFFKLARETFAADGNFEVWTARENGEDVASAIFIRDGDVVYFKWGARRLNYRSNANHLLLWNAIEEFAPRARTLDLGRADVRNEGLMRFKAELGATASPLPSSFYPRAPSQVSAEVLTGTRALMARIWSRLPIFATRLAGRAVYRYLA
jgi:hypothetical protein